VYCFQDRWLTFCPFSSGLCVVCSSIYGIGYNPTDIFILFFQFQREISRTLGKESGRFGALKSDSTHHFFRNACTKSGSLRFSQFSGCWLILSVYIIMSFPAVTVTSTHEMKAYITKLENRFWKREWTCQDMPFLLDIHRFFES
jgi:hypothetical protein